METGRVRGLSRDRTDERVYLQGYMEIGRVRGFISRGTWSHYGL